MRRAFLFALLVLPAACALFPASGQRFVVFFDDASTTLDDNSNRVVAATSDYALAHPEWDVAVSGSADPSGTPDVNTQIIKGRLASVVTALVGHGLGPSRVRTMDIGQLPFALNSQESRRVVIAVGKP